MGCNTFPCNTCNAKRLSTETVYHSESDYRAVTTVTIINFMIY